MSMNYDGIGGIGVKITDEIVCDLIECGKFTEEEWDDDYFECLDEIGIPWQEAGSEWGGSRYYWLVKGKNIVDINENIPSFIESIKSIEINIEEKDIIVIQDIHIW